MRTGVLRCVGSFPWHSSSFFNEGEFKGHTGHVKQTVHGFVELFADDDVGGKQGGQFGDFFHRSDDQKGAPGILQVCQSQAVHLIIEDARDDPGPQPTPAGYRQ